MDGPGTGTHGTEGRAWTCPRLGRSGANATARVVGSRIRVWRLHTRTGGCFLKSDCEACLPEVATCWLRCQGLLVSTGGFM